MRSRSGLAGKAPPPCCLQGKVIRPYFPLIERPMKRGSAWAADPSTKTLLCFLATYSASSMSRIVYQSLLHQVLSQQSALADSPFLWRTLKSLPFKPLFHRASAQNHGPISSSVRGSEKKLTLLRVSK